MWHRDTPSGSDPATCSEKTTVVVARRTRKRCSDTLVTNNTCVTWTLPAHTTGVVYGRSRTQHENSKRAHFQSLQRNTRGGDCYRSGSHMSHCRFLVVAPRKKYQLACIDTLVVTYPSSKHIITDSRGACRNCALGWAPPLAQRILQPSCRYLEPTPRNLDWAPGHQGLQGNEEADQAARALSSWATSLSLEACSQSDPFIQRHHRLLQGGAPALSELL